jgi:hypothetical protein
VFANTPAPVSKTRREWALCKAARIAALRLRLSMFQNHILEPRAGDHSALRRSYRTV